MKIKDMGKNLIPTVDATCEYERCGATVELRPLDVKYQAIGWTARLIWICPCCGHTNEIPRESLPQSFVEEMKLKKDN